MINLAENGEETPLWGFRMRWCFAAGSGVVGMVLAPKPVP
jgi:hypothetical protein